MTFQTHTGNRGLVLEEKLIFEQGEAGRSGVDLPDPGPVKSRMGGLERDSDVGLPGLSEPQVVRHYTRLSQKNFGIDSGFFPLGSCTMKHNPSGAGARIGPWHQPGNGCCLWLYGGFHSCHRRWPG